MGRVPSGDPSARKPAWPARAVCWLLRPPRHCPHCKSREIRFSRRRSFLDSALGLVSVTPFRCLDCRVRFFRLASPRFREARPSQAPFVVEARSEILQPAVPLAELPARARFVLILDNDPAIRKLLGRLLERAGFDVSALDSVQDLELRPGKIDLLIADFGSMRQAELEMARQLEEMHPKMKTIELSSQRLNGGAAANPLSLPKPFHTDELLEMVRLALGDPGTRRPLTEAGPQVTSEGA